MHSGRASAYGTHSIPYPLPSSPKHHFSYHLFPGGLAGSRWWGSLSTAPKWGHLLYRPRSIGSASSGDFGSFVFPFTLRAFAPRRIEHR